MKIAVFGAAGWTGRAVLSALAGRHSVRAIDRDAEAWQAWTDVDGPYSSGQVVHADIGDFAAVHEATADMDALIHLTVYHVKGSGAEQTHRAMTINVEGMWNVLESARRRDIQRIVHVGSCQISHPKGLFFTADVRRPDADIYAVTKRLQEEMCRQFHDAYGMRIIVLRPHYIMDSRLGMGRMREKLGPGGSTYQAAWVCRHDLAEACRLGVESTSIDFDIFHVAGTPEAEATCNVRRSREVLGLEYRGDLNQYR